MKFHTTVGAKERHLDKKIIKKMKLFNSTEIRCIQKAVQGQPIQALFYIN